MIRGRTGLQNLGGETDGDAPGGLPYRVVREMRIGRGRLHPVVAE